jgi:glucans biosynthesis protein
MLQSPRCGAKTRSGERCLAPAVKGKKRCRMHGGARGSGAPRGNANVVTHGAFTKKAIEGRKSLRQQIQQAEKLLKDLDR